jgi:hypothetical protein
MFKCVTCAYNTNYICQFTTHMEENHPEEREHKCHLCLFSTENIFTFFQHVKVEHELFKCDQCEYTTNERFKMDFHRQEFHREIRAGMKKESKDNSQPLPVLRLKLFICDKCNFITKRKSSFTRHKNYNMCIHLKKVKVETT